MFESHHLPAPEFAGTVNPDTFEEVFGEGLHLGQTEFSRLNRSTDFRGAEAALAEITDYMNTRKQTMPGILQVAGVIVLRRITPPGMAYINGKWHTDDVLFADERVNLTNVDPTEFVHGTLEDKHGVGVDAVLAGFPTDPTAPEYANLSVSQGIPYTAFNHDYRIVHRSPINRTDSDINSRSLIIASYCYVR